MASLSSVTIDLKVTGEAQATQALNRFYDSGQKVGTSVVGLANKISSVEGEWQKLTDLYKRQVIGVDALRGAQGKLVTQLRALTGMTGDEARAALKSAQAKKEQAKAADEAAKAAQKQAAVVAKQDAEDRKALQNYLRYQREKERAADAAAREVEQAAQREARAQREAAQETARLAAETQALARAYNPLMAATNVYEREVQQLNRAHELGVLSADALEAKLGELEIAYARVGDGTMKAQNFVNQFGSVTQIAGVKTNRFGMVAQQVGYQVGDFFVQVQSGTNAFVAFGQQATQLAGLLPGLAGAIVGIGISVGTMLLAAYDRTRRASEDFADATFDINEAAKSATEELKGYREELAKLASEYKTIGEIGLDKQIQALNAELKNLEGRRATITGAAATGFGAAGGMMSGADLEELVGDALRANTDEIDEQIRSKREQLRLLVLERESVEAVKLHLGEQNRLLRDGAAAALARNSSFRQTSLELERELNLIQMSTQYGEDSVEVARQRAYYEAVMRGYTEEQRNAYIDLVLKIREAEQALEDSADVAGDMADAQIQAYQQYQDLIDGVVRSQENELALLQEILAYGKDSVEVARLRAEQEGIAKGLVGDALDQYIEMELRIRAARDEVDATADEAARFAEILRMADMGHLVDQSASLANNMALAAENAAAALAARALDVQNAPNIAYAGRGTTSSRPAFQMGENGQVTTVRSILQAQENARRAAARGSRGGGGGGGAAREQEDYLQNLLLEAEQKRRLVGLSEEETRRQEILFELKKRELPLNDDRIEQIIKTEAETRKLIEAEQQREQLMQTIEGNIKSAFMSMVDGSQSVEDAFRNMLRNILLAVYEQQVAAPAAKGISSFLSNIVSGFTGGGSSIGSVRPVARPTTLAADGGAWNNGLQFFANGGVVGSPTMFGHSGGLGVMGEAGPEAIMPLKRGSDGKLGVAANGGSLTVNVVMDPSTGALGAFVQDQAGQVVAKAAPQLAQYANKTMVDQRRRGGTMKAAFRG